MKKILLSMTLLTGLHFSGNAQLANGSIAPDFTLTDINGVSHNLYSYLNQGKTVFIDVSATWCGPCWNFHNTGALEDLWVDHGPAGGNGVSSTTTDDVIVLFIEGDGSTNNADLMGTGSNTQGNWVAGVEHPIIDPAANVVNPFNDDFGIAYFPTIYKICRDRSIEEVGQASATQLYASVGTCPALPTAAIDAKAIKSLGETKICGPASYSPIVQFQNYGMNALTSATVNVIENGNIVSTGTYAGNLAMFDVATVTCSPINNYSGGNLTISINPVGDVNPANGNLNLTIVPAVLANGINVTVEITTDAYGSETTWELTDDAGAVVISGGPYNDLQASGTTVQTPVSATLNPTSCYTFSVYDQYGDGMDAGYGVGSYTLKAGNNSIIFQGGVFESEDSNPFKSGAASGAGLIETNSASFSVYPNPTAGKFTIKSADLTAYDGVELVDQVGRVIYSSEISTTTMDMDVTGVAAGSYVLIFKGENKIATQKIQINK